MSDETIHIEEELKGAAHKVEDTAKRWTEQTVSYTHLTLPTSDLV